MKVVEPSGNKFEPVYQDWKNLLETQLQKNNQ